jgi:Flp pilus assembly protein TadG
MSRHPSRRADRRGAIAILTALMLPAMLAAGALILDGGLWMVESTRLQIAADAAANGVGYLLADTALQGETAAQQQAVLQAVALAEADGASDNAALLGSLVTPVSVSVAADWSSATVTLTAQAGSVLAGVFGLSGPTLTATATVGSAPAGACVLALNPSASDAIDANNMGVIKATGCGIFADSSASDAIYLNSGTIDGETVAAVGDFAESNSGSNTLPVTPTDGAAAKPDPFAALTPPSASGCDFPSGTSFTAWKSTPYAFSPANNTNVFCGNTTIGGNGSTDTFAPGVYYVIDGNLIFNNATITQASGVSFVLTGSSPGALQWTNYSNTNTNMTAPSSGPTAGILFWQECGSGGASPTNTMAGGSSLVVSGAFYAPCGKLSMSNNAQFDTASAGAMSVIANTIEAVGSAGISAAGASTGNAAGKPRLTQ